MKQVLPMLKIPRSPLARHGAAVVLTDMYFGSSFVGSVNSSSRVRFRPVTY